MTKKQIEMLRWLIQKEIDYAIQDYVNKNPWSYGIKEDNDKYWEEFTETFNSEPTEPLEIDA